MEYVVESAMLKIPKGSPMLFPLNVVKAITASLREPVILHVGAHLAEERFAYEALKARHVHWVESQGKLCEFLRQDLDVARNSVHQAAAWSATGLELNFHVTNNSQSSSVFELKQHLIAHPEVFEISSEKLISTALADILPAITYDLINIDIQGAELQALIGLGNLLESASVLYLELNKEELYDGIALVGSIDKFLKNKGFRRLLTIWVPGKGWGDGIYTKGLPSAVKIHAWLLFSWFVAGKAYDYAEKKVNQRRDKRHKAVDGD